MAKHKCKEHKERKEAEQHCKFVWRHVGTDYCNKVIECPNCGEKVNPFLTCIDPLKCNYAELQFSIVQDDPNPIKDPLSFLEYQ